MPKTQYVLEGNVTESTSEGANNVRVYFLNNTTNEIGSELTDSGGDYIYDCANLTSGVSDGDIITIFSTGRDNFYEGQDVADFLSRKVLGKLTTNHSNINTKIFNPNIANNNPMPYDETHNLFRRTMTIQFQGLNQGEN